MTVVLDASAMLAYLQDEPGSEVVDQVLAESVMSSVNWAEVIQKSIAAGVEIEGMLDDLQALGLRVEPFTPQDGELTGRLWEQTRQAGLSLGAPMKLIKQAYLISYTIKRDNLLGSDKRRG